MKPLKIRHWALAASLCLASATPVQAGEIFRRETLRLPDVVLTDQNGRSHRLGEEALSGLMVVTFAYTTCDSICPIGTAVMAELDAELGAEPLVRLVTITIDPRHDTPAVMRRAAREMDASENWLWLTGEPQDIDRLLKALGAKPDELMFHDPLFLVGDFSTRRFYRSQALPEAGELLHLIGAWRS